MNNYQAFRDSREDAPTRWYEAAVFVSNATRHLLNSGRKWHDEEITELVEARGRINDSAARQEAA